MKLSKHDFTNEDALTLAEVLASVVVLTIILILFSSIFAQSWRTTKSSENILDATYYAQLHMENMYALSKDIKLSDRDDKLVDDLNFNKETDEEEWSVFRKDVEGGAGEVFVKFKKEEDLIRVLVQVHEQGNIKPAVQMENYMNWEGS